MEFIEIVRYADKLVPERNEHIKAMETLARERKFPIIGPAAGYFCYQIARMINAKKIFELGSGYGYSTAWFALAISENGGGIVHHTVWDDELSSEARSFMSKLGYEDLIKFHVSEAVEALKNTDGEFDLIFNDIDKEGYPDSLEVIETKLRPGGVMIIDNMIWGGRIFETEDHHPSTEGVLEFTKRITESEKWIASLIPIRDGLILGFKK